MAHTAFSYTPEAIIFFGSLHATEEQAALAENFLQQVNLYAFYMEYTKNDGVINAHGFTSQKISMMLKLYRRSALGNYGVESATQVLRSSFAFISYFTEYLQVLISFVRSPHGGAR